MKRLAITVGGIGLVVAAAFLALGTTRSNIAELEQIVRRSFRRTLVSVDVRASIYNAAGQVAQGSERRALLVDVVFNGETSKTLIEIPMKNAYKRIFESGIPIRLATISAHRNRTPLYSSRIWGSDARRIVWEGNVFLGEPWRLWETTYLRPGLRR